ncbi:hypothetical protein Hanom_Chr07g00598731 [Helianthus anomalus]
MIGAAFRSWEREFWYCLLSTFGIGGRLCGNYWHFDSLTYSVKSFSFLLLLYILIYFVGSFYF